MRGHAHSLYFCSLIVKEKLKLSQKYLPGACARDISLFMRQRKTKNHLKSAARCAGVLVRLYS